MVKKRKEYLYNIIALIVTGVLLFPLYWMIISSLKNTGEIFASPPTIFPRALYFDAYKGAFSGANSGLLRYFLNSVIIAGFTMILTLILAVPAAYGLARYRLRFFNLILFIFLMTQMLPSSLILTPLFISFSKINILNTYLAAILADATITIPFAVIILRTYFLNFPKELEDSARIDGCNIFTTFIKIAVPITYPGIFVSAAISFLMAWGDLIFALTFINDDILKPISLSLYNTMTETGTEWNRLMACSTVIVLPVLLMFIFLQKYLVSGLTAGALKG